MSTRARRGIAAAAAILAALLLSIISLNSKRWVGTTFPGFFVMANRVVPSVSLPSWFEVPSRRLFQHQVLAVDAMRVGTSQDVYEHAKATSPGTPIRYTLRAPQGQTTSEVVPSRVFSGRDYLFLFGAYIVNGAAFIIIGLVVFWLKPHKPASLGLLSAGLTTGVFVLTAVDLYGPHWFFRLHVLAESLLPAAFLHLALVFPTQRLRSRHSVAAIYSPFLILALAYEIYLQQPAVYSFLHLAATAEVGLSGTAILLSVTYDFFTTQSALVRRRIGVVALGTVTGFLLPTILIAASGFLSGRLPINAAALTAFLFPLSMGYAIVKQDLFQIDVTLRRAMSYVIVLVAISVGYFVVLYVYGILVPNSGLFLSSPTVLALLNLCLLFLIAPLRSRVQRGIDRVFFRQQYDPDLALAALGRALGCAHTSAEVAARTVQVFGDTFCPERAAVVERQQNRWWPLAASTHAGEMPLDLPAELLARFERGETIAHYEWEDGGRQALPQIWRELETELVVPVRSGGTLVALVALGRKSSGRAYSMADVTFLRTAANQVALALSNAATLSQMAELNRRLEKLNLSLEQRVRDRTAAVEAANAELNRSLEEIRLAYQQLEESQAGLLRAERLATLGRLTAGIAHEMNTPLSAVRNALKILTDLGSEYASSIRDPDVGPEDHLEIAREIETTARSATEWAGKAAAFIRSVKTHGRELRAPVADRFTVRTVVAEIRTLLAYRLRAVSCRLEYREEPEGTSLVGDPWRLSQVLVNLITNAIDAYEDIGIADGQVRVEASRKGEIVKLTVRDWAGGIPADVVPHIFDELYTTKGPGHGTGLGLWIARNLVEEGFGGTLDVVTTAGLGSCFTACLPIAEGSNRPELSPPGEAAVSPAPGAGRGRQAVPAERQTEKSLPAGTISRRQG